MREERREAREASREGLAVERSTEARERLVVLLVGEERLERRSGSWEGGRVQEERWRWGMEERQLRASGSIWERSWPPRSIWRRGEEEGRERRRRWSWWEERRVCFRMRRRREER